MAEGQYTGSKAIYLYLSDDGTTYLLRRDITLANVAEVALPPAADADLNKPILPNNIKPRFVYWEGVIDGKTKRKELICPPTATAFIAKGSTAFEVDGSTNGGTTGRVGEKSTFLRIKSTGAAGPGTP